MYVIHSKYFRLLDFYEFEIYYITHAIFFRRPYGEYLNAKGVRMETGEAFFIRNFSL